MVGPGRRNQATDRIRKIPKEPGTKRGEAMTAEKFKQSDFGHFIISGRLCWN